MEKLYWSDRIRTRAVCKSWLQIALYGSWLQMPFYGISTINEVVSLMPEVAWLMRFGCGFDGIISFCNLISISTCKTIDVEGGIKGEKRLLFQTSRCGWVLFGRGPEESPNQCYSFFLHSPFTDEIIELPKLDLDCAIFPSSLVATFSLSLYNPDCLVFCLHIGDRIIGISTCRSGDETWKTLKFQRFPSSNRPRSATYLDGSFYCTVNWVPSMLLSRSGL
ncbi:hypothetical protein QQP08_009023 [Theobroma cacao]|nr:hypothetical protein QQP08_009023 [Theobroma cacao]